jgi:hypothetical protein
LPKFPVVKVFYNNGWHIFHSLDQFTFAIHTSLYAVLFLYLQILFAPFIPLLGIMIGPGSAAFALSSLSYQTPQGHVEDKGKLHRCYHGTAKLNAVGESTVDVIVAAWLLT